MNREFEKRQGKQKRPELSDLNESGQIESDASVVLFPHRPSIIQTQANQAPDDDEIVCRKNRDGAQGVIPVKYQGPYFRFDSLPGK
jgi:replicative DNA helicase